MADATKEKKPPRISAKVKEAIDVMIVGKAKTITEAAEQVGITREHLSREISRPHITEHLRLKVLRNLVVAGALAGDKKVKLLESENAMVADRASSFILGLLGISPQVGPHVSISPRGNAGYVIDLSEPTRPGLQIVIQERVPVPAEPTKMIDVTPPQPNDLPKRSDREANSGN